MLQYKWYCRMSNDWHISTVTYLPISLVDNIAECQAELFFNLFFYIWPLTKPQMQKKGLISLHPLANHY